MKYFTICLFVTLSLPAPPATFADPPTQATYFPKVFGPTGRPYGPTQAHYQYQRQYGRAWHGMGGYVYNAPSHYVIPIYGYAGGPYGDVHFAPVYNYVPMSPLVMQGHPLWIGRNPFDNDVLHNAFHEDHERWNQPLEIKPAPKAKFHPLKKSTPEAKLRSINAQVRGDHWLRKQEFLRAYDRYKTAIAKAKDRAEPHFRAAYALVGLNRFSLAVKHLKQGLELDPLWPLRGDSLTEVFGDQNALLISSMKHKVIQWARADIRDADRLFLMGVLMHFDDDAERAQLFFETAVRLSGRGEHLQAFLRADNANVNGGQNLNQAPTPKNADEAPLPNLAPPAPPPPN